MANILDYMDWRGDLSFDISPFNEVDNLILSVLSYLDFESIVPGSSQTVGIRTASRLYREKEATRVGKTEEMTAFSESFDSHIPELLHKVAASRLISYKASVYQNHLHVRSRRRFPRPRCAPRPP